MNPDYNPNLEHIIHKDELEHLLGTIDNMKTAKQERFESIKSGKSTYEDPFESYLCTKNIKEMFAGPVWLPEKWKGQITMFPNGGLYEKVKYFRTQHPLIIENLPDLVTESGHKLLPDLLEQPDLNKSDPSKADHINHSRIKRYDLLIGIGECHYLLAHKIVLFECEAIQKRIQKSMKLMNKQRSSDSAFSKFGLTPVDIIDISGSTDFGTLLAVITYLYTGYLKIEAEQVPVLNQLCHRLQCASLSQYLKFQRVNGFCSRNNDGSVNVDYERDLEILDGIQLKAQLVFEKKVPNKKIDKLDEIESFLKKDLMN